MHLECVIKLDHTTLGEHGLSKAALYCLGLREKEALGALECLSGL